MSMYRCNGEVKDKLEIFSLGNLKIGILRNLEYREMLIYRMSIEVDCTVYMHLLI